MKSTLAFFILILFTLPANSIVNMKNASFTDRWIDIIVPGKGYDFRIERQYNSRSLFIGLFGFGWCSDIETKMSRNHLGEIRIEECGGGLEVSYYPTNFDQTSTNATIDKILKAKQKAERMIRPKDITFLQSRLKSDPFFRYTLAKKYHLVNKKKMQSPSMTFVSTTDPMDKVHYNGKSYIRKFGLKGQQKYDKKGNLVQATDVFGQWIKMSYKESRISNIVDNLGRRLVFAYNPDGSLQKIYDGQGLSISYKFKGENLTQVTNAWKNSYSYNYDFAHNLTQVTFPDGTAMKMTYDHQKDWIRSYVDRKGCDENYKFVLSKNNPKNHYWSTVDRKCGPYKVAGKYEFWYKLFPTGKGKYIDRMKKVLDGQFTDNKYHPSWGYPTSITKNRSIEKINYNSLGLVSYKEYKAFAKNNAVKEWNSEKLKYNSQTAKIIEARHIEFEAAGKQKKSFVTKFKYTSKGLLSHAERKNGKKIRIQYDDFKRISHLKLTATDYIQLSYTPLYVKPVTIRHSQKGKVAVTYAVDGEIVDVSSQQGKQSASAVIDIFMDFIDIVGPAANELRI